MAAPAGPVLNTLPPQHTKHTTHPAGSSFSATRTLLSLVAPPFFLSRAGKRTPLSHIHIHIQAHKTESRTAQRQTAAKAPRRRHFFSPSSGRGRGRRGRGCGRRGEREECADGARGIGGRGRRRRLVFEAQDAEFGLLCGSGCDEEVFGALDHEVAEALLGFGDELIL